MMTLLGSVSRIAVIVSLVIAAVRATNTVYDDGIVALERRNRRVAVSTLNYSGCGHWTDWISRQTPTLSSPNAYEHFTDNDLDVMCPSASGNTVKNFRCRDEKTEPIHNNINRTDVYNAYLYICSNMYATCFMVKQNAPNSTEKCPDFAIRIMCVCPPTTSTSSSTLHTSLGTGGRSVTEIGTNGSGTGVGSVTSTGGSGTGGSVTGSGTGGSSTGVGLVTERGTSGRSIGGRLVTEIGTGGRGTGGRLFTEYGTSGIGTGGRLVTGTGSSGSSTGGGSVTGSGTDGSSTVTGRVSRTGSDAGESGYESFSGSGTVSSSGRGESVNASGIGGNTSGTGRKSGADNQENHKCLSGSSSVDGNLSLGGISLQWWLIPLVVSLMIFVANVILVLCVYIKLKRQIRNNQVRPILRLF